MRIKITKCYSCICNVCTRFRCPYPHWRCYTCTNLDFKRIYDCDWFENRHTAPKRFRIARKGSKAKDELNAKLDLLLESLGLIAPAFDVSGTFVVYFGDYELFRGSHADAKAYIARMQSGFRKPLRMCRISLEL